MSSPAEGLDYFKGLPCGVDNCPSRWFYKDNGKIYCKGSNHEQQVRNSLSLVELGMVSDLRCRRSQKRRLKRLVPLVAKG